MERTIESYMIKGPYVCEPKLALQEAMELMVDYDIRHLPVVDDGKLVGLLSDRDLRGSLTLPGGSELTVADIMKREVFVARRSTPLKDIARAMQEKKIGSTVIVNDESEAVGIFTVTDALGILADLIEGGEGDREASLDDFIEEWEWETVA